jgi:hypothetical protein
VTLQGGGPTVLVATAVSTALFHTLIPDHWLPFVLIGLARRWTAMKTAFWSGLSALIHIAFSIILGLAGIVVGQGTALVVGEAFEKISGLLLVVFGIAYAAYARAKGGHFHIGGQRVHRAVESEPDGVSHGSPGDRPGGDSPDEDLIRSEPRGRGPLYLATIIGLNPCVLVLPLLMKSPQYGTRTVVLTALAYGASTLLMMVGLTVFGVSGGRRIEMPFLHRYGEIVTGLGIAAVGAVFLIIER